jgi:ParB-like chromosome segregation protein Spo0J
LNKLKVEMVPVDSLSPDPANVRRHPERNLDTIKASLRRFGQQKPIVVDAKGIVRAGNGTLEAAKALGWDKIAIVRSDLAGSEATAFAIADNRSAELAEWDGAALAEQLRSLQSEDFDLGAVGYDDDEIAGLIDRIAGEIVDDPAAEWEGMPAYEHDDLTSAHSINVHFKTMDDLRDFAGLVGQSLTEKTKAIWHPKQDVIRYGDAE